MNPLPESLVRFRTELEAAIRREQEAQATARSNGWGARMLRAVRRRPGRTTLALVAVAGAAAAALFVSSPWQSSPGFLDEVQAALTPPAGTVLHYRTEATRTSADFGCTVTSRSETWIDQKRPYRYRLLTSAGPVPPEGPLPVRTLACTEFETTEIGGSNELIFPLFFDPPDTLTWASGIHLYASRDPLAELRKMIRDAIRDGRAHHEGKTELDGRVLERIRLDPGTFRCPPPPCSTRPSHAYVDPETFLPVRLDRADGLTIFPGPGDRTYQLDVVIRFLEVEYLPRTAENLALTDIRAQHPDATGPGPYP